MASVSSYLNFNGKAEEAMNYYADVFGTEKPQIMRYGDMPGDDGKNLPPDVARLVMNSEITILDGYVIRAADTAEMFSEPVTFGTSMYICLDPDSRADVDRLFEQLSQGGSVKMEPSEQFWGGYFADCTDRFGIQWLFNCTARS